MTHHREFLLAYARKNLPRDYCLAEDELDQKILPVVADREETRDGF